MKTKYLILLISLFIRNGLSQDIEKISLFDLHPSSERKHEYESVWRETYDTLSFPIEKIRCESTEKKVLNHISNVIDSELKKAKVAKPRSLDIFYLFKIDFKDHTTKYMAFFANYGYCYNGIFFRRDKKFYRRLMRCLCDNSH